MPTAASLQTAAPATPLVQMVGGGPTVQRPPGPPSYFLYFDTTLGYLVVWNGTLWVPAATLVNPLLLARAWVNFDGTGVVGQPCTLHSAVNVGSVTKLSTGRYQLNFSPALDDTNYCYFGSPGQSNGTSDPSPSGGFNVSSSYIGGPPTVKTQAALIVYNLENQGTSAPIPVNGQAISVAIFGF